MQGVFEATSALVDRARRGDGPGFLLCKTYRFRGHHVGDVSREHYRTKREEQQWVAERDPIAIASARLVDQQIVDRAELDRIQAELTAQMDAAVQWAIAAPYPAVSEVAEDVYA